MLGQVLRALSSTQHVLLPGPFLMAPSRAIQVTHHNHVGICSGLPSRGAVTPGDSVEKARLHRPLWGDTGLTHRPPSRDTHTGMQRGPGPWLLWTLGPTPPAGTALEEVSPRHAPCPAESPSPLAHHWDRVTIR